MNADNLPSATEVQRPIIYPYRSKYSRHLFVRVHDAAAAREFLRKLLADGAIVNASKSDDDIDKIPVALNIGFTYAGLEALRVPKPYLYVFNEKARAFAEGANLRAARRLADTGRSAAPGWDDAFQHRRVHIYMVFHGERADKVAAYTDSLLGGSNGLDLLCAIDGAHLTDQPNYRTVHFGFRDNVANPTIRGWPRGKAKDEPLRPSSEHEAGEFVLGYKTNNTDNPWLLISPSPSSTPWLLPRARIDREFFWNGSFGVFRKMEQDVAAFEKTVRHWAEYLQLPGGMKKEEREAYVRAKICGRWDNGQVVCEGEYAPTPSPVGDIDDFDFKKDAKGLGCPFSSHIRRMNPRADDVVPKRKRPLIRRGMPYGRAYQEGDAEKRGLLGLFFCASLEDQFEHLLCEWGNANPMGPPNRGTAKDPFTGAAGQGKFDIPTAGDSQYQLDPFRSAVTTRGTVYAFFPSLKGIAILSREPEPKRAA